MNLRASQGPVTLAHGATIQGLQPDMLRDTLAMAAEFKRLTGATLRINSGYRSTERQRMLYEANPLQAAKPGRSMHEYGLAIDVPTVQANKLHSLGLLRKYRLHRPLMRAHVRNKEPWHIERTGLDYAVVRAKGYTPVIAGGGALLLGVALILISQRGGT